MQIRNNSYLDTFYAVIQTKLLPVRNPKPCLKYKCSLVFDVIDFNCDLKLFKAFNRKYFDVADSLITIPCCINYDGLYKPIAFLLIIIIIFAKKSNNQTVFAYSTSVTAQCLCSFEKKEKVFPNFSFPFFDPSIKMRLQCKIESSEKKRKDQEKKDVLRAVKKLMDKWSKTASCCPQQLDLSICMLQLSLTVITVDFHVITVAHSYNTRIGSYNCSRQL